MHTYIHTYIHTYVHTYIRTYVHTHIRTYVHTYIHTYIHTYYTLGRDSSVGIATRYGLDGPGFECQWGDISRSRPDRPWGPPSLLYNGYRFSFPGVKRQGRGVNHPLQSTADIRERLQLYLYSPFGPS
jgi:hypothetical protein